MQYFECIGGAENNQNVSIDETPFYDDLKLVSFDDNEWQYFGVTLPQGINYATSVVYNGEIHLLGGYTNGSYLNTHYVYNGTSWSLKTTLPQKISNATSVVYNEEIHLLGGHDDTYLNTHYIYSKSKQEANLPQALKKATAVVYNNEIHFMNGLNISNEDVNTHYIYNGNSWTQKDPLPRATYECSSVVYNEKIHVIGGYSQRYDTLYNDHFVYDGSSWTNKADLPMGGICRELAIVYDWKIHLIGGYSGRYTLYTHYTYDGETHTIAEWSNIMGISRSTLSDRIYKYHWDISKALTQGVNK